MSKQTEKNSKRKDSNNVHEATFLHTRDYNMIKWLGANSYRTSHYPYAEELMDFADTNGIVIVDECPAVALDGFKDKLLEHHLEVREEAVKNILSFCPVNIRCRQFTEYKTVEFSQRLPNLTHSILQGHFWPPNELF